MPAPVKAHNCLKSWQPSEILFRILSLPTLLQLQTNLPKTGSGFFPLRNNCKRSRERLHKKSRSPAGFSLRIYVDLLWKDVYQKRVCCT